MRAALCVFLLLAPLAHASPAEAPADLPAIDGTHGNPLSRAAAEPLSFAHVAPAAAGLGDGAIPISQLDHIGPLSAQEARSVAQRIVPDIPAGWLHEARLQGEPAARSDSDDEIHILPAGDLDDDGRDDLWRLDIDQSGDEPVYTLLALGGPALNRPIYAIEDERSILFVGDTSGDGISEIATASEEGPEHDGVDVYTIHDGRDGSVVQELRLPRWIAETESENRTPEVGPLVLERTYRHEVREHYEYPLAADGGFMVVTIEYYVIEEERESLQSSSTSTSIGFDNGVRRIDAEGQSIWERSPGGGWSYSPTDLDLDGGRDAMGRFMEFSVSDGEFFLDARFEAIDGGDGTTRWTVQETSSGDGGFFLFLPQPTERVHGEAPEVTYRHARGDQTVVTVMDARSGDALHERPLPERSSLYQPIGDIDGDGLSEIAVAGEGESVFIQSGQDKVYWSGERVLPATDLNGDGVRDLRQYPSEEEQEEADEQDEQTTRFTFLDARNGKELWSREATNVISLSYVQDVDQDGGSDVVIGRAPDADEDSGSAANETLRVTLVRGADGASFWTRTVYHPKEYVDVAPGPVYLLAINVGDLTGNGAADVAIAGYTFFPYTITFGDDGMEIEEQRPPGDRLSMVRIFDAATGQPVYRAEAMERSRFVAPQEATLQTAADDLQKVVDPVPWGTIVLVAGVVLVVAVAGIFTIRRRTG